MSKIIGKYEITDVTKDFVNDYTYKWIHIFPSLIYRHKFWYMWEYEIIWWKWNKRIEVCRTDWKDHPDRDEKLFWKRLKKCANEKKSNVQSS